MITHHRRLHYNDNADVEFSGVKINHKWWLRNSKKINIQTKYSKNSKRKENSLIAFLQDMEIVTLKIIFLQVHWIFVGEFLDIIVNSLRFGSSNFYSIQLNMLFKTYIQLSIVNPYFEIIWSRLRKPPNF